MISTKKGCKKTSDIAAILFLESAAESCNRSHRRCHKIDDAHKAGAPARIWAPWVFPTVRRTPRQNPRDSYSGGSARFVDVDHFMIVVLLLLGFSTAYSKNRYAAMTGIVRHAALCLAGHDRHRNCAFPAGKTCAPDMERVWSCPYGL